MSSIRRRKKNNSKNILGIIVLILLVIYLLGRMGNKNQEYDNKPSYDDNYDSMVIVVGNVKNSPKPDLENNKSFNDAISQIFYSTESGQIPNIMIISATSSPKTIDIDKKYLLGPAKNSIASESNLNDLVKGINLAVQKSPSDAGADYFDAILMAADYVKDYKKPLIIVYGSGLSDAGLLNFAFNDVLLKQDEDENYTANLMINNNKITENKYSNISLIWFGCGQGVNEQPDLKEWKNIVEVVYTEALTYMGINSKFNSIAVSSNTTNVDTDYDVAITTIDSIKEGYTLNLTERFVTFEVNTANILNIDETKELLTAFADKMSKNNLKINITGYQTVCAKTDYLGRKRAEAIKDILVSLGINEDRIETSGVAGPPDDRVESPRCGTTGVASEHRTVRIEVKNES